MTTISRAVRTAFSLALAAGTATLTPAQDNGITAGFGRPTNTPIDLEALTTNVQHLGVAYLNGTVYVSSRGSAGITASPHSIYAIDAASGSLIADGQQTAGANATVWGFRDGDSDGTSLLFGGDGGVTVVDPTTLASGVSIGLSNTVMADNGPQTLASNPIAGPALAAIGNLRGVAYDPSGNGGNGSIWTGNFGTDILEIDLDGNILQQFANQPSPDDWSIYGLALDPVTGNLWCNAAPNQGDLAEIDTTSGTLTGRSV